MVEEIPGPLDLTEDFDEPVEPIWGRVAAGVGLAVAAGWVIAMAWLGWAQLSSGNALTIASFVALVSTPLALGGVIWLLVMRTSRAEARRFGTTARAMRTEAARLERVITAMSRRLDDNRQALHDQTNQLLVLGESAASRIAMVGTGFGEQAAGIEASAIRLNVASTEASQRLGRLLDGMPEAHGLAEAMALSLTKTGTAAVEQVTALDHRLDAVIERSQSARLFADDAVHALGERLIAIANAGDQATANVVQTEQAVERVNVGLVDADARLATLHQIGVERAQQLAASISTLGGSADAMTASLRTGDDTAQGMIARAEQALIAVDAVAREIDETLPAALARLDTRIGESRGVVATAQPELFALVSAAQSTHESVTAMSAIINEQRDTMDRLAGDLAETLEQSKTRSDALGVTVEETIGRAQAFSREAAPQLVDALLRVRDTANTAADRAREALAVVIPEAAAALESSSTAALKRAAAVSIDKQIAALTEAAEVAVEAAQRASERLTRQLVTIADTTAAVEARINEARAERENCDEDSIARRSSFLLESLNSNAIDLSDALAAETSDSAWAAYLKGDRGVFTRRAVRLLDGGTAREIATLYDSNSVFRDNVNRYIHDFEGMLRGLLATREGSPLAVTLLSSDMGKLYVALAQAIDRLRT